MASGPVAIVDGRVVHHARSPMNRDSQARRRLVERAAGRRRCFGRRERVECVADMGAHQSGVVLEAAARRSTTPCRAPIDLGFAARLAAARSACRARSRAHARARRDAASTPRSRSPLNSAPIEAGAFRPECPRPCGARSQFVDPQAALISPPRASCARRASPSWMRLASRCRHSGSCLPDREGRSGSSERPCGPTPALRPAGSSRGSRASRNMRSGVRASR